MKHVYALLALVSFFVVLAGVNAAVAQTNTPTPTATSTPTVTSTPDVRGRADRVRALNEGSFPSGFRLGDFLQALWSARQSGGGLTANSTGVDVAAITAMVNGVYVTKTAATGQAVTACGNTTGSQYRKCTLCMNQAATLRFAPGAVAASQAAALKPSCSDSETEIAYLELPTSFTAGSTSITSNMLKQAATRASAIRF
jgi:hypothetical protein